jgi:F-type H+-transporting ATPase subunit b
MRCWLILLLLLVLTVAVVSAAPALAAAEPGHEAKHGDEHENKDDSLFGKALDLGIYTIVVFLLLLLILSKYAWGPMLEGLQKREENIRAAIDDARKAREETEQMRRELQVEIAKAHDEQRRIVDEAHKNAQRLADEMKADAQKQIQADRERLHREIHVATDQALVELWKRVAGLATEVSSKAIQRQLTEEDHRRLVDEALKELQQTNGHKG